jgi:DNA-binding NarL/FixJ family response regulator
MIRILVVEDHLIVAEALADLLAKQPGMEVVGVANTIAASVELASTFQPDVVLMDFRLPDGTGDEAARAIRIQSPASAVVFLTADDSPAAWLAAVGAGACGYLLKSESGEQVTASIRRAAEGEMIIPHRALAELLVQQRQLLTEERRRSRYRDSLTPRETEVLRLMTQGLDNRDIADTLHLAVLTVRTHVQHVLAKLEAHSKLEAVVRAAQLDLLPAS